MIRYDNDPPGPETAHSAGGAEANVARQEPSDLQRERDDYYERLLRVTAEFDNYRRRAERERRELSEYVVGEFAKELIPVLDDFTRALEAPPVEAPDPFRQGMELVHKRLVDVLARRGVTVIDPLGETFDPHRHEAVTRVAAEGHRDGEIVEVFSHGYAVGDRLLRPAMVKVATA